MADLDYLWSYVYYTHSQVERFLEITVTDPYPFLDLPKAKYFFCLCALYPLAYLWRLLPMSSPTLKHVVNLVVGLWFAIFVGGKGIVINLGAALAIYMTMLILPSHVGRWIGLLIAFGLSSLGHVYRFYYSYMAFTLDFTLVQMLMTLKLVMYCFDIHDGSRPVHQIDKNRHAKTYLLRETPGLLPYLGYMFFFPSLLVGPMHPFREYRDFISGEMFGNLGRIPRGATRQGLIRLAAALFWLPVYIFSFFYNIEYTLTDEFLAWPFVARAAYMIATAFLFRPMYYYVWLAVEGALVTMGYGYNGHDPETNKYRWNRASNVRVLAFELAQQPLELPAIWNIATGRWLKYYFYARLVNAGYKNLANPVTFAVSALWHGFYPGYYFLFAFGPILTWMNGLARKKLNPRFLGTSLEGLYRFCCVLGTWFVTSYLIASFLTLNWENTLKMYGSVNYFGHIAIAVFAVFLVVIPAPHKESEDEKGAGHRHHDHKSHKTD
jgi:lysophospholipid acyltransferase